MWILKRVTLCSVTVLFLHIGLVLSYLCKDGSFIEDENVCDFANDCKDGEDESTCPSSCDFEEGLCEWYHETDTSVADLQWTMWSNDAPSEYSGPSTDHTTNSDDGHYRYVDDTNTVNDQAAILRSPDYQQAARGCTFSFYYFIYGEDFGTLEVLQYTPSDDREYTLMHVVDGSEDETTIDKWNLYQVEVEACAKDFRISIKATDTKDNEKSGGYAIDDLQFEGCAYTFFFPPDGLCPISEGQCDSGHCFPANEACDYTLNCCDGTDESQALCVNYNMCDFEGSMCDWEQLTDDTWDWTRQNGETDTGITGPSKDHTTRTNKGHYVYTEVTDAFPGDTYRLGSFYIQPTSSGCQMRFYHHLRGSGIGVLNVFTRTQINGPHIMIWSKDQPHGDYWVYESLDLTSPDAFQVVFEGVRGDSTAGDIALDDITFTPQCVESLEPLPTAGPMPTPAVSCPSGQRPCNLDGCIDETKYCDFKQDCLPVGEDEQFCPDTCSFDDDMCYWSQDVDDDIDWSWYDVSDVSPTYQGPAADHTTQTSKGRYMFVDATSSRENQKARLLSPVYKLSPRACSFSMWFYMFGVEYGDLEVKIIDDSGLSHVTRVRDNAFDYNKWILWESEIRPCTSNFQIAIETEDHRQVPIESGFAVDDVSFAECTFPDPMPFGRCGINMMQCTSLECYSVDHHCDMSLDCCDGTDELNCLSPGQGYKQCDFESGLCDWEQLTSDEFDWTWQQGGTPDNWRRTGPQTDHTLGTADGWYIFTESSDGRKNGDRASIVSFPIASSTECYMRFFYHMEGQGIGTLIVYTRTAINGPLTLIWSRDRSLGEQWNYANLHFSSSSDFQVVIEGVVGYTAESDIGLDDISFTPECQLTSSLPALTTQAATEPTRSRPCVGQYRCEADNTCIDLDLVCSGVEDCSDGQDEQDCPEDPGDKNTSLIIGLSVTFGLLFLVACGGGAFYIFRTQQAKKSDPGLVKNDFAPGVSDLVNGNSTNNSIEINSGEIFSMGNSEA